MYLCIHISARILDIILVTNTPSPVPEVGMPHFSLSFFLSLSLSFFLFTPPPQSSTALYQPWHRVPDQVPKFSSGTAHWIVKGPRYRATRLINCHMTHHLPPVIHRRPLTFSTSAQTPATPLPLAPLVDHP
jgi:hypothetical protein